MARLFDMYMDTASPDLYNPFKSIKQETEANRNKTWENVGSIMTKTNLGKLQQEYREGSGRYAGITDPDKRFQVYYDAVRAIDPKEAETAKETYNNERNLRMNREVSEAYKGGVAGVDYDINKLESDIKLLEDAIDREEQVKLAVPLDSDRVPSADVPVTPEARTPWKSDYMSNFPQKEKPVNTFGYITSKQVPSSTAMDIPTEEGARTQWKSGYMRNLLNLEDELNPYQYPSNKAMGIPTEENTINWKPTLLNTLARR